jgi:hypothetical protein
MTLGTSIDDAAAPMQQALRRVWWQPWLAVLPWVVLGAALQPLERPLNLFLHLFTCRVLFGSLLWYRPGWQQV